MSAQFGSFATGLESPFANIAAVTPGAPLPAPARGLWIGGAGDVVVTTVTGATATFVGVPAGTLLPVLAASVGAATTATNIVAGW